MNINQQQNILTLIDQFDLLNIDQLFIEAFPGETDFSKVNITKYSAADFKSLARKMLNQLKREVSGKEGLLLPVREHFQNEWGELILEHDLTNLYNSIVSKNFPAAEPQLDKLIYFQIRYGFWEKSAAKQHSIPQEELIKQKELINLNSKAIGIQLEKIQKMLDDSLTNKELINEQLNKLSEEVTKFNETVVNSNESVNQINNLLSNARTNDSNISVVFNSVKEKLSSIETDIDSYKSEFDTIINSNSELDKQLNKSIIEAKINLDESSKNLLFIDGQRSEIEKLTGMAADGALGTKFDQRQVKLNDGLKFWKWAVPLMTVIAMFWVVAVFLWLKSDINDQWIKLGINLLKTAPAFILLGFVFKQYTKERNLQEEYAFKSAVAMTLTAYSNMLASQDVENNKSRQEMLLKSIEQLYAQPIIHNEKPERLFSFNTKNLKETVANLTEAINNIKSK